VSLQSAGTGDGSRISAKADVVKSE
jgi:hypothetical protein